MTYLGNIFVLWCVYAILGVSLNLLLGLCGRIVLCHGALAGIGAYTYALLSLEANWAPMWSLFGASLAGLSMALLIGFYTSRLRDDIFTVATLAFQAVIFSVFYNAISITRGPYGIPGIPRPFPATPSIIAVCFLSFIVLSIAVLLFYQTSRSPMGRVMRAIRENGFLASTVGICEKSILLAAFAQSGFIAGLGGAVLAAHLTYIEPNSFAMGETVSILMVVVLGGSGNLRGPFLGALIVVLLPEALRFLPDAVVVHARQALFGLALVGLMRYRPSGLWGAHEHK